MRGARALVLGLGLLTVTGCGAGRTLRIYEENDVNWLGGGTDRYYSQGFKIEYTEPIEGGMDWLSTPARWARLHPAEGSYLWDGQYLGLALGHQIYTPEDITRPELIVDDRPYAGWLHGAFSYHKLSLSYQPEYMSLSESEREAGLEPRRVDSSIDRLDSLTLEAGMVGPSSLARDIQVEFHKIIDARDPRGWDNQLHDEVGVNLIYSRRLRHNYTRIFEDFGHDFISNITTSLGNVHTYFQVGGLLRLGYRLRRDFGIDSSNPDLDFSGFLGEDANPRGVVRQNKRFSCHVFFGIDGRAVGYNMFLDGNTRKKSHEVSKERFVADFKLGASVEFEQIQIGYTQYIRTPEFRRTSDPQIFGSLQVAFKF